MRWRSLLAVAIVATPVLVFVATRLVWNGGAKKRQPATLVATRDVAVSRLRGPQSESAIAIDPRDGRILLAGSNDIRTVRMALYASTDGGRHWTHGHLPAPAGKDLCGMSGPAVAIDGRGRQYYAFLGLTCVDHRLRSSSVYWSTTTRRALIADPESGQLWVCYYESGRRRARKIARYACTASDDGGETWSRPRPVARVASDETGKRANRANGYGDYEGVAVRGGVAHAIWTDGRDLHGWGEEIYSASVTGAVTAREAVK
jgi:hypothetical protein